MKVVFFASTICLFLLFSCKKEDSKPADTKKNDTIPHVPGLDSNMRNISASAWIAYRVDVSGINVWNSLVDDCMKHDTYRFYKDSNLTHYENAIVCSGNPDSIQSKWIFLNNYKKISATILGIKDTGDILKLTSKEMKIAFDYMGNPATAYFKKP